MFKTIHTHTHTQTDLVFADQLLSAVVHLRMFSYKEQDVFENLHVVCVVDTRNTPTRTSHNYGRFLSPPPPLPHIDSHAQNLPVSSPSWQKVSPPPWSVQYEISANHSFFSKDTHRKQETHSTHARTHMKTHTGAPFW